MREIGEYIVFKRTPMRSANNPRSRVELSSVPAPNTWDAGNLDSFCARVVSKSTGFDATNRMVSFRNGRIAFTALRTIAMFLWVDS
jgi:hypothetical protein